MLQAEEASKTVRTDVTFVSNGLTPAGHLHTPDARAGHPLPAIVVIHPWGGAKEQTAGLHARRLTEHGFIALAFEAAHQGASEGEPHFLENPVQRAEDIESAVHLGTQRDVDPDRIGALDISTGGSHAVHATISDQRIRAVGTVSAACIGSLLRDGLGGGEDPAVHRDLVARSGLLCTDEALGEPPLLGHIVPEEAVETTPGHLRQGTSTAAPHAVRTCGPRTRALRSVDQIGPYDSFANIGSLAPRPLLMIAGSEAATAHVSRMAVEQAGKSKELFWLDGASHFDLYGKDEYVSPRPRQTHLVLR